MVCLNIGEIVSKFYKIVLVTFLAFTIGACGASNESLCREHATLTARMAEQILLIANNPGSYNEAEFKKVSEELAAVKGKLEAKGSSGKACP